MAIRKEQALFLVTLALGVWMFSGIKRLSPKARPVRATEKSYEATPALKPITVTEAMPENLRDRFHEPSESRPLPPRDDLPFPELGELPVVLLPLEVGQQPGAYWELRHPPLVAKSGEGEDPQPKDSKDKTQDPGSQPEGGQEIAADPRKNYDALFLRDLSSGRTGFPGRFLGTEAQKFDLASRSSGTIPKDAVIEFQWIDHKTGKLQGDAWKKKGEEVEKLELAKTLRNEIGMRLHQSPPSGNVIRERELIEYLLSKARQEPWVYEKALERAEAYRKLSTNAEEGYLYVAKVLRAKGDLPGIYRLFRSLDEDPKLKGSSFQLRGLGLVEAKLGLDMVAEEHLLEAVAINQPIDARNDAALARFYLQRGRAREAVAPARRAVQNKARRDTTPAEQVAFHGTLVRALLAVGDIDGASRQAAGTVPADLQVEADYQRACIAYASKKFADAETRFQAIYNTGQVPDALLGLAAAQIAQGEIADATVNLRKVVDEQPRLRHLGYAGLGLVSSQSKGSEALELIRAGIVTFPNHPYLLYLQGRQRRLNGDLEDAIEPLKKALRAHDDFLEALAELAVTHHALYLRNRDARALVSAVQYVDRLVKLDQKQGGKSDLFLEMQGKYHFDARDWRGAEEAFKLGWTGKEDQKSRSLICGIGLAILEYVKKRSDLAETRLRRLNGELDREDPYRKHSEHVLDLMIRHGNKEQVLDRFDRRDLGEAWEPDKSSLTPKLEAGELRMEGKLKRSGRVAAVRKMAGPGRFLEFSAEMKVGAASSVPSFAGIAIEIPDRSKAGNPRFRLRVGMDEREELVILLKDGRVANEPIRTKIKVTRGGWHRLVISVDDADDADPKGSNRFLKVYFDGEQLISPEQSKLKSLRRRTGDKQDFHTEFVVEGSSGAQVDLAFRNYRRIQEKVQ